MNSKLYSLLPYLESERGCFHLDVSLISEDSAVLERAPFPFLTITDTDPLTRLIDARIRTDAGSEIERVFLLLQKDRYLLAQDELWPLNNRDIEEAWQKAFSFYSSENKDLSFITLAGQLDGQGRAAQMSSLFYCRTRQLFFHPPCPKCGLPLQQCLDDALLNGAGLQSYSGSLKRYLYCPVCTSAGKQEFYVYELEQSDPQTIRDRTSLIKKFKLLVEGNKSVEGFPCTGCPNYKDCYGAEQRVLSRIVPFSFYPFHMFIFKALSINAPDFLSLVSGAPFRELEEELENKGLYGRSICVKNIRQDSALTASLLFGPGYRNFREVLYLKLTFLAEVFQDLLSGHQGLRHPDLRLSLDNIWVKLPEHGSRLPFLWNFRVTFTDIFRQHTGNMSSQDVPGANALFFMGLAWFYALLVNRRQDISMVYQALKEIMDKSAADSSFSFDTSLHESASPVFHPSSIFRDPEGKNVNTEALLLWEKALMAGWSVLKAGHRPVADFSPEKLLQQLDDIREEVRGSLFSDAPSEESHPLRDDEKAISVILKNIYDKLSSGTEVTEESLTETVVLSPEGADRKIPPPAEESGAMSETVIIPAAGPQAVTGQEQPEKQDDFMTETVILSPQRMKDTLKPSPGRPQKKPDDVPAETVIISAGEVTGAIRPAGEQPGAEAGAEEKKKKKEQDFLAETIILKPGELKGKGKK